MQHVHSWRKGDFILIEAEAGMALFCGSRALAMASVPSPASMSVRGQQPCADRQCAVLASSLRKGSLHLPDRTSQAASFVLHATIGGVEPDLPEAKRDPWMTAGEDDELYFPYGKVDGAHTYHDGQYGPFWESFVEVFETSGGPVGLQGTISWLYPLGLFTALFANAPAEFYVIYTSVFVWLFISYEFVKPDQPWHFEPDVYYDPELLNGAREPEKLVDRPSKE